MSHIIDPPAHWRERAAEMRSIANAIPGLARAQHQTVEQRCVPAMADVMQFELLARPACLTAVLGAQQRVAANDRAERVRTRIWPLCRLEAGRRYTLLAHVAERHRRADWVFPFRRHLPA
jgi:hypothetical protein